MSPVEYRPDNVGMQKRPTSLTVQQGKDSTQTYLQATETLPRSYNSYKTASKTSNQIFFGKDAYLSCLVGSDSTSMSMLFRSSSALFLKLLERDTLAELCSILACQKRLLPRSVVNQK